MGGEGLSACSGDILLESLVACAGVTLGQIAKATHGLDVGCQRRPRQAKAASGYEFRRVQSEMRVGDYCVRQQSGAARRLFYRERLSQKFSYDVTDLGDGARRCNDVMTVTVVRADILAKADSD